MLVKIKAEGMSGHYVTNKGMLYTLYQQVVFQDTLYQRVVFQDTLALYQQVVFQDTLYQQVVFQDTLY